MVRTIKSDHASIRGPV